MTVGVPIKIVSESILTDFMSEHQPLYLKSESKNLLLPPEEGRVNHILRTVEEGDLVELKINTLRKSNVEFSDPIVQNIENQVCLAPFQECSSGHWTCTNPNSENVNCRNVCTGGTELVCTKTEKLCLFPFKGGCVDWCSHYEERCKGWSQVCDQRRVCDRIPAPGQPALPYRIDQGAPGASDFAWICDSITAPQCAAGNYENQWQRITKLSPPYLKPEWTAEAVSPQRLRQIIDGLSFEFSNEVRCKLSDLKVQILAHNRLAIEFTNTEKCTPFNESTRIPGHAPSLSILNQISFASEYTCGEVWENYQGNRTYTCVLPNGEVKKFESTVKVDEALWGQNQPIGIHEPYYPQLEIEGELRFVGSYLESQPKESLPHE